MQITICFASNVQEQVQYLFKMSSISTMLSAKFINSLID